MLTALDFPEELLYTTEAMWVRTTGPGSVRVGLHFYALERDAEVVHVSLPRAGARLVRGTEFGHVDFDGSTFPLIAPCSGMVLAANLDLRDSPSLLRSDPFGAGFLVDMEDVSKEDVGSLLDRDGAVAAYSRFEPPGPVRALLRYEAGRPWFSSLALRYGDFVVAKARLLPPASNEIFVPDWEVGDRWIVETRCGGLTRRLAYEVLGDALVAGEETRRVRVSEVPVPVTALPGPGIVPPEPGGEGAELPEPTPQVAAAGPAPVGFERILYFREEDFTLAAIDEIAESTSGLALRRFNDRGRDLWLRVGPEDGFIVDHPRLPVGVEDETRNVPAGAGKDLPAVLQFCAFRGGLTRLEVTIRAEVPRLEGGTARLLSTQVWEAGLPWWREAERSLDGKELVRGTLVLP